MKPQWIVKIGLAVAGLLLVAAAFGSWSQPAEPRTANAQVDPVGVIQDLIDAANASDGAAAAALFTEDGTFADIDGGSFLIVGRPAIESIFSQLSEFDPGFHVTLLPGATFTSTVSGTQVEGVIEYTDDDVVASGGTRILQPFVAQITDDGLIASIVFTYDESDPETAQYLAYLETVEDDEEGLPPGAVTIELGPGQHGNQPGQAFLFPEEAGITFVAIQIAPGPAGVLQPAHLHTGTCDSPGPVIYPLASVLDGSSFTILSADMADILAGNYILNVHESEIAPQNYVACGEVAAAVATPAPVALPDTGDGSPSEGSLGWLLAVIGALGVSALAAGVALRVRRS